MPTRTKRKYTRKAAPVVQDGQATDLPEQKAAIDPTVPLMGVPEGAVKTAQWGEEQEVISRPGLPDQVFSYQIPVINGIKLGRNTPRGEWRKVLDFFPKT